MHNIETPLYHSIVRSARGLRRLHARLLLMTSKRVEGPLVNAATHLWVCSETDAERLHALYAPSAPVSVVPNAIDLERYAAIRQRPEREPGAKPTLIFCGNFTYHPNLEAAHALIQEILPLVRKKIPGIRLLLVGHNPSRFMKNAARLHPDIVVTGFVHDVREWLSQADIAVMPLREGGGTRLKVLEAFAAGMPVVATTKAIEGLRCRVDRDVIIADNAESLASRVIELLEQPEKMRELRKNAFAFANENFSFDAITAPVEAGAAI